MKGGSSIYDSLKIFYFILKILGLAPYTFDKESRKFKFDAKSVVSIILSLTFWVTFSWIPVNRFWAAKYNIGVQSNLLSFLWKYQYIQQYFLGCLCVLFAVFKQHHVENLLNSLFSFDENLRNLKWNFRASRFPVFIIFVILFIIALTAALYVILSSLLSTNYATHLNMAIFDYVLDYVAYTALTELFLMICVQFIMSAYFIIVRLRALRKNFNYLLAPKHVRVVETRMHSIYEEDVIKQVSILYDYLARAVDEVNSIFSKQMILVFISTLILEVFTTYFAIKVMTLDLKIEDWIYWNLIFWNLFLTLPSLIAIYAGALARAEGRKLYNLVGEYLSFCQNDSTLLKLHFLFNKMSNRPIVLSCGFFNIDLTLGLSLVATITAYMIIICQFEHDV